MQNKPLVSIIMPLYNTQAYIDACIESILAQKYPHWELLIVNDFSTDNSKKIVLNWVKHDKRIHVYDNSQKGIIPALNLAFNKSKGAYITRMDADDLMPAEKLELFVNAAISAKKKNVKQIITGKVSYFSDKPISAGYLRYEKWLNELVIANNHWEMVYRECVIASPNWMVSRNCFSTDILLANLHYPEDYDMVFNWYAKKYEIITINKITHLWREHPNRTSRLVKEYQQNAFFSLKTNYFIQNEQFKTSKLQLIGAGDKGKMVAKILLSKNIVFDWLDIKPGTKSIAGINYEIKNINQLHKNTLTILTVWPTKLTTQTEIVHFLNQKKLVLGKNCFLF